MIDEDFIDKISTSNNAFTLPLYKKIMEKEGNVFISPFNVTIGLLMSLLGARNDTRSEILSTLKIDASLENPFLLYKGALGLMQKEAGQFQFDLTSANSLWANDNVTLIESYMNDFENYFGDTIFNVDFSSPSTIEKINEWVHENTNGKISNIIDSLNSEAGMALINTIYFNCRWNEEFDEDDTKDLPFHLSSKESISVPTMNQIMYCYLGDGPGFKMIGLLYKGKRLGLLIILPTEIDGLSELEKKITIEDINKTFYKMESYKTNLYLPLFNFSNSFELTKPLTELGMKDCFTKNADFSGMTAEKTQLTKIIHKTFVEVNEEGTEAAAATYVETDVTGYALPHTIRVDHPFMFVIRHLKTKSNLFIGRVMNPLE